MNDNELFIGVHILPTLSREKTGVSALAELPLQNHVLTAFATPVAAYPWPDSDDLNRELSSLVLAEEKKAGNVARSNVGGWHSPSDFLHRDAEPLRVLRDRVMQMARG